jgi:hypothetical protein
MMSFRMPIENENYERRYLQWEPTERDRQRADINHGQTLERLAQRGGMSWCEMAAILSDRPWHRMTEAAAIAEIEAEGDRRREPADRAERAFAIAQTLHELHSLKERGDE